MTWLKQKLGTLKDNMTYTKTQTCSYHLNSCIGGSKTKHQKNVIQPHLGA